MSVGQLLRSIIVSRVNFVVIGTVILMGIALLVGLAASYSSELSID